AGTAFLDTALVNGTTYYYVVRSNNGTDSVSSAEVNKAPIANFTFSSLTAASSTSLNLTWTAATGADTYRVVYGLSTGSTTFSVSGLTGTSYTLGSLSANTQYFVKVVAENTSAATNTSSELNATTATSAPVGLTATATTAAAQTGRITLNWTATTGAANYNIYKSTTANTYGAATATAVTGTSWVDTAVTDGTPYYYKITANNGIQSALSNEATAKSIANFSISSITPLSPTSLQVSWPATAGADSYDLLYRSTGATTTISGVTSATTIIGLSAGTTYFIKIKARNSVGGIATAVDTAEVTQVTPVAAPTALALTNPTVNQINLTWTAATGATNYRVFRSTTSNTYDFTTPYATGVPGTSYTDAGSITNGTTYFYVMRSFNGAESATSSEVSIKPINSFTITAVPQSSSSLQVTWSAVSGADSYDLSYGTTTGSYTTTTAAVTSPQTISGLAPGSTYFIIVTAKNIVGSSNSRNSAEVGATTAFGAPSGLAASATPTQINLTWNAVSGVTSYKVFRRVGAAALTEIANSIGTASYSDTTAVNGTTYDYTVRAFNGTDSLDSNIATRQSVGNFTLSSAITASASSVNLSWTAATGAASYDIYYGTATGSYGAPINELGTTKLLTGLVAGTTYFVRITAKNAVGVAPFPSVNSGELSFITSPAGITDLAVTSTAQGTSALAWTAPTSATSYTIKRGTTTGSYPTTVVTAHPSSTYADSLLTNGTTYYY
ncbi:MAG TPA: fibronectin type III domain-containing protein, partial [Bacteriovoracaceae bacterium]|nr:fibronectin type III domain-containing protein [Bacteriovoracaceae bacterium]